MVVCFIFEAYSESLGVTLDTLKELARPNTDFDCVEKAATDTPAINDDQCPYFGKPCAGTHNCGWDDPDKGIASECQHGNVVCGQPENKCMLGPP